MSCLPKHELSYTCLSEDRAEFLGYADPALEGQTVMFICPHGQTLNGSNSSTHMGNGEWEPDPREVECTGGMGTTGITTSGMSVLNVAITYVVVTTTFTFHFGCFQFSFPVL